MTDAQTEARTIALAAAGQVHDNADARWVETLVERLVATALTTERAAHAETKREGCPVESPCARIIAMARVHTEANKRAKQTEAQRDEALKALVIANANLDNMEFLSIESFMDWREERRTARRALEAQGDK